MSEKEESKWPWPVQGVLDLATGRDELSILIPPLLWLLDGGLTSLVVWKIPYTEIDWVAYMEQIAQFVAGERDYTKMEGGTGPLVYPAAHVYTFTGLYYITGEGKNIFLAQQVFAVLYLATLALVMLCYWKAKVPPYVFVVLILSKRLHSIFVLRCFNDCFAVFFFWLAIYFFQRRYWTFGAVAYSWGLGIKMSLLLSLPAVIIILFLGRGLWAALRLLWLMAQVQIAIAVPFMSKNAMGYLGRAFELSRQFKYEWTVNWRFVPEDIFLSRGFALALLAGHVTVLLAFIITRYLQPTKKSLAALLPPILRGRSPFTQHEEDVVASRVTPEFVMMTMLSANAIGLLFARSLHYQFYAYIAWATPYLIWRIQPNAATVWSFWAVQEWSWNVFPSTTVSSIVVVVSLYVVVAGAFLASAEGFQGVKKGEKAGDKKSGEAKKTK